MAKLVYAMNQSLDGYVDHDRFAPDTVLFRHFIEDVRSLAGVLHGRRIHEMMSYWMEDQPEWDEAEREFADAWRRLPKWVASRTLDSAGPGATLIQEPLETAARRLKAELDGVIEVAGPKLAAGLSRHGLIDEYRIYLHPAVLGAGTPYFAEIPPPLRLVAHERIGEQAILLTYVPA